MDVCLQVFAGRLLTLIDQVYRCLPLGTIIDGRVLVVHGGVSETTDLRLITDIDRHKVKKKDEMKKEINAVKVE